MTPYSVLFSALRGPCALFSAAQACRPVCCCFALRGGCFVSLSRGLRVAPPGLEPGTLRLQVWRRNPLAHSF